MHLSEVLLDELEKFAADSGKDALDIVETGTIRGEGAEYQENDGWSTLTFAEYVKRNGGSVTSIDLEIATAARVLKAAKLDKYVRLTRGHSIEVLAGLVASAFAVAEKKAANEVVVGGDGFVDVAFLDSDNNGSLIFHEYLIVKGIMRSPGLIIVDDVDIRSKEVVKGHEILPWAEANNIPHRIVERGGADYRTGVLVFEV